MIPNELLLGWCRDYGIELPQGAIDRLDRYAEFLVEYNEKVNLTAITEPQEIACKHFLDSLLLLKAANLPKGGSLIDVGTGAGFPGVPVRLAREDISLTLLDSLGKRITFLNQLCERLGLQADCIHARAEEGGQNPELRERFDLATARAVANLSNLCEYCLPFVRVGGIFAALKSKGAEEEAGAAGNAIRLLGGKLEGIEHFTLPDGSERNIILIKKISQTSAKYPRPAAKIAKKPL